MEIPEKVREEGLVEYAERLSEFYARTHTAKIRKLKGQFFTPKKVSVFMTSMFEIRDNRIRLLDPGAGIGVLTAAFCERLSNNDESVELTVDAYENDPNLLPLLNIVLESCRAELERRGHNAEYNIYEQDFILHNEANFKKSDLFRISRKHILYDFVISNPPYHKLNKDSPQSTAMMELISGQPNIYPLFMALSANVLKPNGEMVFITPRSFCSGLYYKKFREWFLSNVQITNIHIFESRKEIFDKDQVLQENIIMKAKKLEKSNHRPPVISISKNKNFKELRKIQVQSADVIYHKNGEVFIRIPTSPLGINVLHIVDAWPNTLRDLGLEISTGPVVPFRAKQYLLRDLTEYSNSAPLLWMHNIQHMKVAWPLKTNKKASAINVCDKSTPLLLPVKNYVLVKRFTSKEQKRRLYAGVLLESEFPYKIVGIENHINYIHRPNGNLSVHEAFGIASILNTTVIDNFFRSLNGNTQVNASDVRSLPFPQIEDIIKIGKLVYESFSRGNNLDLEVIVAKVLRISDKIIKRLNKGEIQDE